MGAVVRAATRYLDVLVVDDGSSDGTAAAAAAAGAQVLRQTPNRGKGAALKAGFREALAGDARAVVTLDADGQHDPGEIPRLLKAGAATNADLVVGTRDYARMPPVRRLSNTLGRWILSLAVGTRVPDNQSGYRLISRRLMEAVLTSSEEGFAFEVEVIAHCIRRGYPMEAVPIATIYTGGPSHIRPWSHVASFLRMAGKARRIVRGGTSV